MEASSPLNKSSKNNESVVVNGSTISKKVDLFEELPISDRVSNVANSFFSKNEQLVGGSARRSWSRSNETPVMSALNQSLGIPTKTKITAVEELLDTEIDRISHVLQGKIGDLIHSFFKIIVDPETKQIRLVHEGHLNQAKTHTDLQKILHSMEESVLVHMPDDGSKPKVIAFNQSILTKHADMEVIFEAHPSASDQTKKMIEDLNANSVNFFYFSEEGLQSFREDLIQQMMIFQTLDAEPHAQTKTEDIYKMNQPSVERSSRKDKLREEKDPFSKTKEVLFHIMSSYQEKVTLEKERAQKAREEEKENKIELEKRDRKHEIEKKEEKEKNANVELSSKNQTQHAQLEKNATDVDAKTRNRKSNS